MINLSHDFSIRDSPYKKDFFKYFLYYNAIDQKYEKLYYTVFKIFDDNQLTMRTSIVLYLNSFLNVPFKYYSFDNIQWIKK
jgi:hypothetical protein